MDEVIDDERTPNEIVEEADASTIVYLDGEMQGRHFNIDEEAYPDPEDAKFRMLAAHVVMIAQEMDANTEDDIDPFRVLQALGGYIMDIPET